MTSPSTRKRAAGGSRIRTALADARNDPWTLLAAVATFLLGAGSTWYALRIWIWPALTADLDAVHEISVVAVAPWDVILLQAQAAFAVGLVLAGESVCYRARGALLGERWSPSDPIPGAMRALLVAVGVALFPLGAALGYDRVVPVVLDILAGPGSRWTVVRWGRVSLLTAVVSGIAAQFAFVGTVLSLSNWRR
ncbi:hypothetical protein [Halosimplex sp. TS25]|uniref:hypothetical protein n=1 Tax=Halosimplex rarum TaxID=3396619 RepID=UPI0039EC8741